MIAILILALLAIWSMSKIPHLLFELRFYSRNSWNFLKDSGREVTMQNAFLKRFPNRSLGLTKLLVLLNQSAVCVAIFLFLIGPLIFRK